MLSFAKLLLGALRRSVLLSRVAYFSIKMQRVVFHSCSSLGIKVC